MIKYFALLLLFTQSVFADISTPRDTMRTFLKSMVEIKKHTKLEEKYYKKAITTLDLSDYNANIQLSVGKKYANKLIFVFDRMEKINYEEVPEEIKEDKWIYDKRHFNGNSLEIALEKNQLGWQFTKLTLNSLKSYHEQLKNQKVAKDLTDLVTTHKFISSFPPILKEKIFLFKNWQWIGFALLFITVFLIELFTGKIASIIIHKYFAIFKRPHSDHLVKAINPFRKLIFVLLLMPGIQFLDLPIASLNFINRLLLIIASVIGVWLSHKIVLMFSYYFTTKAKGTKTKFDDIMIPLLTKTALIIVYIVGAIIIAHNFTIDVTGVIAGLGIGGLAFAFAAKDTLANFFGSIMLVLDRPFDIGDVIVAGDLEGTVTEVGFRSTRIRTFYDSVITVSNGELVNRSIDNKGKRRYRRLNTTLGLEYDTPPEKIEAFCEGIRQIILNHKWTRKDNFNVYFVNFGASSLDIQLMVFWETPDYAREQAEKHRLMIDILRLAKELGVSFAFPTQTLHLFTESQKSEFKIPEKYLDEGIELAKNVIQKPFSLRNPRSNAQDKDQFGGNDIGLE